MIGRIIIVLGACASAQAQPFSLQWQSIDAGGTSQATGATFEMAGTTGQIEVGPGLSGGSFQLEGGIWAAVVEPCPADVNGDGALDILDFVAFQAFYVSADPRADCTGEGELNILDFVCYQNLFVAGCE